MSTPTKFTQPTEWTDNAVSLPKDYLVEKGIIREPDYCDWCDRYEMLGELYHGDMAVLALCAHCVKGN